MKFKHLQLGMTAAALALTPSIASFAEPSAKYEITPVAEDLDYPWSLSFLPNGDMLVTELSGQLRIIRNGELDPTPIAGVPPVYYRGQGGLFEALPHPDFENNNVVFLSYAHGTPGENATRIARAVLDDSALTDVEVIFTVEPLKDTPVHYGGRMAFLPDGTLVMTTGDGFDYREDSQRPENLLGVIVRINEDGSIPSDNPFVGNDKGHDAVWSYGHRNGQGIVYDTASGTLYMHEHGPRGGDEINIIEKGKNYGWPAATHGIDYSGARISPFKELDGMENPLVVWTPSIAPAGFALYNGDQFPEWKGDLFVAALAKQHVRRVDLENGNVVGQEELFTELNERIRDVRTGPDGNLYIVTDKADGDVLKVSPASATN